MGENPCPVGWGTLCPGDPKEHWPPSTGTPNSQALRVGPSKSTQPWLHQNAPPPVLQTAQGSSHCVSQAMALGWVSRRLQASLALRACSLTGAQ